MNAFEEVDEEMTEEGQKRFKQGVVLGETSSGVWKYGIITCFDEISWCPLHVAPACIEEYMRVIIKTGG